MTHKPDTRDRVIFRQYPEGDVIALLIDDVTPHGLVASYMHVGQHGSADYTYVLSQTKRATSYHFVALLKELRDRGYNLKVVRRRTSRRAA